MRYRIVALLFLFVLPVMYPFAAPAPKRPYAILDIGPPPKGKTAEEHRKVQIGYLTIPRGMLFRAWCDPEVKKLGLYQKTNKNVKREDFDSWLGKTIQVTPEKGGRRLRLTCQVGSQAEQAVFLNSLLRQYVRTIVTEPVRNYEKFISDNKEAAPNIAKLINEEKDVKIRKQYQRQRKASLERGEEFRDEIIRLKQVDVIKWAK